MKGEYTSGEYPRLVTFYEVSGSNINAAKRRENAALTSSQAKVRNNEGSDDYFCVNTGSTHTRINKASTDSASCATSSAGGICLSLSSPTKYPKSLIAFDATTGASASAAGSDIDVEYKESDQGATLGTGCNAGSSSRGAWASCGQGPATSGNLFVEGAQSRAQDGTQYTLHHANAMIEKFQIEELSADAVFAKYYIRYPADVSGTWTEFILGRTAGGSNTVLNIAYQRTWDSGSSNWNAFTTGSGTRDIGSSTLNAVGCKIGSTFYTGDMYSSNPWSYDTGIDFVYKPTTGKFYTQKFVSLMPPNADVDLICPQICQNNPSGTCLDSNWYKKGCPKQNWNSLSISSSSSECTGGSCNYYTWSSDTAYKYKFKTSDAQLYTLQDNSGTSAAATVLDTSTVTWSTEDSNEWAQTLDVLMIPGTTTTDYDSQAEVDAYFETPGNVFYRVKIGRPGGYAGWTFYPKKVSDSSWLVLTAPLRCSLTMETAFDANGGTANNGAVYDLVLYETQTHGLEYYQTKVGNSNVGESDTYVASPQIANGALCTGASASYRLKSQYTMSLLSEAAGQCSAFDTMSDAGEVPTATEYPANKDSTLPTAVRKCIHLNEYSSESGCAYTTGTTRIG